MSISKQRVSPETLFAAVSVPHFIAQTLAVWNPSLRKQPFAVIEQNAESHKTPILAISRAADELNIRPGTPVFIARRRWPRVKILARDVAGEARLRKSMDTLLLRYTPVFTLRENGGALLDMTGTPATRKMDPENWARHLQNNLRHLGLEAVSVGVASSQIAARVLARLNRPDGVQVCPQGEETSFLDPVSPDLLPGLSSHCRELLKKYGLPTIASVRRLDKEEIVLRFGGEGEKLYSLARGWDFESISMRTKSVSAETVLTQDLNDQEALRNQVRLTADKLGHALRLNECKAGKMTLILTYSDKRSARRTATLEPPTSAFQRLAEKSVQLFGDLYQRRVALRRVQLQVTLPRTDTGQTDLFDTGAIRKQEALEQAVDRIRSKRSFESVISGSNVLAPAFHHS